MACPTVVHVIGDDTAPHRLWRLQTLLRDVDDARVIHVGHQRGSVGFPVARIPLRRGVFSLVFPKALREQISKADVLHFWSTGALLRLTALLAARQRAKLVADFERFDERKQRIPLVALEAHCVAPSQATRQALERYGLTARNITVIPPGVDESRIRPESRIEQRAALGIDASEIAIAISPALGGDMAAKQLCWGVLIAAHSDRRLVVLSSPDAREDRVLRAFSRTSRFEAVIRRGPECARWPEALSAADLFLGAPCGYESAEPAIWTAGAGVPMILRSSSWIREVFVGDDGIDVYDAEIPPRALARRVLRAAKSVPTADERERRRRCWLTRFSGESLRAAYAEVYERACR